MDSKKEKETGSKATQRPQRQRVDADIVPGPQVDPAHEQRARCDSGCECHGVGLRWDAELPKPNPEEDQVQVQQGIIENRLDHRRDIAAAYKHLLTQKVFNK